jgi:hypothetical protein
MTGDGSDPVAIERGGRKQDFVRRDRQSLIDIVGFRFEISYATRKGPQFTFKYLFCFAISTGQSELRDAEAVNEVQT